MGGKKIQDFLEDISTWFSQKQLVDPGEVLADVPPAILNAVHENVSKLPTPQPYQVTVREAVTQALQAWQANPETTSNSLVVLSAPTEAIAPILKDSFQGDLLNCDIRFFLGGYQRPPDPSEILSHLQREIEPEKTPDKEVPSPPVTASDRQAEITTVMVIPSLEQCFLRCIQGWEGVEYLQTFATQDSSRFWVFGCNHWAWAFLDKVCQVSAYLENVISLPQLTKEDLQTWLSPLLETFLEIPKEDYLKFRVNPNDAYWDTLANLSLGVRTTAAYIWLRSLQIQTENLAKDGTLADDVDRITLLQTKSALPELMTLEAMDRYLLHSLLIHGEMTRSHLALSLGETERNTRSRVQVLQRESILLQRGRRFSVHPAYYPKIRSELGNNNFLIGEA